MYNAVIHRCFRRCLAQCRAVLRNKINCKIAYHPCLWMCLKWAETVECSYIEYWERSNSQDCLQCNTCWLHWLQGCHSTMFLEGRYRFYLERTWLSNTQRHIMNILKSSDCNTKTHMKLMIQNPNIPLVNNFLQLFTGYLFHWRLHWTKTNLMFMVNKYI